MSLPVGSAYQVVGANSGATALTNLTVAGTANQVVVTPSGSTITLSTPQNIGTGSSPTFATLTLTAGLVGTATNDDAAAGKVGEYLSVSSPTGGTATPGSTDAFVNITSMSLTAGDWDVWGTARFDTGGAFVGTRYDIGISLSSAAADSTSSGGYIRDYIAINGAFIRLLNTGVRRISLSGTVTVYLVGSLTYGTLGVTTWGSNSILMARRVR